MSSFTWPQRREIFVDARDIQPDSDPDRPMTDDEYKAVLTTRGKEKLSNYQLVRSFETNVRIISPTYTLGEDYHLGDTVTVIDDSLGVMVDANVRAVEYSVGKSGEEMNFTLGYGQPTIYDALKRKAGI